MLPKTTVKARLSFVKGKFVQPPNVVVVPAGAKRFPVTVAWSMESDESYVIGSHDPADAHRWCVLDANLAQVMRGAVKGRHGGSKKAEPVVSRTLHGGGAHNPRTDTFEFTGTRLKNGAAYTLVASRHGMIAAIEFVAVRQAKPKPAPKRRVARPKAAPKVKRAPAKAKRAAAAKK